MQTTQPTNLGTGSGGANTNYYGKLFENKTNNQQNLLNQGYTKHSFTNNPKKYYDFYLTKSYPDKNITYVLQHGLKVFMKNKYNINIFRCPDEAYIIEHNSGKIDVKILEKKEQNVEGSVETKLWSSPSLKREYELVLGSNFTVTYALCLSEFLQKKLMSNDAKYQILNIILNENSISVLYGDNADYFETLVNWIYAIV